MQHTNWDATTALQWDILKALATVQNKVTKGFVPPEEETAQPLKNQKLNCKSFHIYTMKLQYYRYETTP